MHVNEAVERGGKKHVQVFIVLNLGDPAPMSMHFHTCVAFLVTSVLRRPAILQVFSLLLCLFFLGLRLVLLLFSLPLTLATLVSCSCTLALTRTSSGSLLVAVGLILIIASLVSLFGIE